MLMDKVHGIGQAEPHIVEEIKEASLAEEGSLTSPELKKEEHSS